ncbi:MAG: tRNA 2-thiouridine(34) synthase MnmA [Gaiellaceae bacterium]
MTTTEVFGDATRGGEWASVRLWVCGDVIVDAHANGLASELAGRTLLEAAAVTGEPLAVEALAAALGQVFTAARDPERAVVAMSGGVDSAVTLLRAAPNAIGVTLRLWQDPAAPDTERACCSPAAVAAARSACHSLGLPHVTLDLREEFRRVVVQPFADGYEAGETPNPCIRCNGAFRFDELLAFASRAGAGTLWTGHYARVVAREGKLLVGRAADGSKDQSYMLATLAPEALERIRFPLGDQTKEETRAEAARAGLAAATRSESQEACFLGGGDYRDFLERDGLTAATGAIVDQGGEVLGRHDGYWRFTSGQRRGLGIAAARPLYVLRTEPSSNTVVVGTKDDLAVTRIQAEGAMYVPITRCETKLRYGSPAVRASVTAANGGFTLELDEPAYAVARGQFAVVYDGDAVVGAGVITNVA